MDVSNRSAPIGPFGEADLLRQRLVDFCELPREASTCLAPKHPVEARRDVMQIDEEGTVGQRW